MVEIIKVPDDIADGVESEVYAPLKPIWQFYRNTTEFYSKMATPAERKILDAHAAKYGPMIDTQRLTYPLFSPGLREKEPSYEEVIADPNSRLRRVFRHVPALVRYLTLKHIPPNYKVHRCMMNLQTIRPQWSLNAIHPDVRIPGAITILYYVNTSDGDTFFFNDEECIKRVPPIKGTAAKYPSSMFHAGSTPVKNETRSVINIVFQPV